MLDSQVDDASPSLSAPALTSGEGSASRRRGAQGLLQPETRTLGGAGEYRVEAAVRFRRPVLGRERTVLRTPSLRAAPYAGIGKGGEKRRRFERSGVTD